MQESNEHPSPEFHLADDGVRGIHFPIELIKLEENGIVPGSTMRFIWGNQVISCYVDQIDHHYPGLRPGEVEVFGAKTVIMPL